MRSWDLLSFYSRYRPFQTLLRTRFWKLEYNDAPSLTASLRLTTGSPGLWPRPPKWSHGPLYCNRKLAESEQGAVHRAGCSQCIDIFRCKGLEVKQSQCDCGRSLRICLPRHCRVCSPQEKHTAPCIHGSSGCCCKGTELL